MIRFRLILTMAGCVALTAPVSAWAVQAKPAPPTPATTVELTFPARPGGPQTSAIVSAPGRTARYRVLLKPVYDVDKHLTVMDLELCRVGVRARCGLLEPAGNWRGAQPFDFFAYEFTDPPRPDGFGRRRSFSLGKLGLNLQATVVKASVKPFGPMPHYNDYVFNELTVEIAVKDAKTRRR